MRVRFQADADLNEDIVAGVVRREPGIDFETADEASLRELPDSQVLALAAAGEQNSGHSRSPHHASPLCRLHRQPKEPGSLDHRPEG